MRVISGIARGTKLNSIESLSTRPTLNNNVAVKVICENLEKTRLKSSAVIMKQDYKKTIEELSKQEVKFDFIFLDPPYQSNFAVDATKRILSLNLLNDKGNIIIETDDEKKELEQLYKNKRY